MGYGDVFAANLRCILEQGISFKFIDVEGILIHAPTYPALHLWTGC